MWNSILKIDKIKTGDIIESKGRVPFFNHYAIVFYRDNVAYVAHCVERGVVIERLEDFEKKRTVFNYFRNEITKKLTDKYIEEKANDLSAYGYNFMEMNCEDFVKRIAGTYIGIDDRIVAILIISLVIIISLSVAIFIIKRK